MTTFTTFTPDQLHAVPHGTVTVVTKTGEQVTGVWDGYFTRGASLEVTGCQVLDKPPFGVRWIPRHDVAEVWV